MIGAQTGAVVAVKKFIKKNEIAPVRIALEYFAVSIDGAAALVVAQKNMGEPA